MGEFSWAEMLGDDGTADDDSSGDQAWHIDGRNGDLPARHALPRRGRPPVRAFGDDSKLDDSIGTFILGAFSVRSRSTRRTRTAFASHWAAGPP
eukprot:5557885-Prymnesium_polylepis.1